MKRGIGTGAVTESECVKENVTEMIPLVGKVQGCLEGAENAPGAGRGTRNAHGNGNGTEITETDTANLDLRKRSFLHLGCLSLLLKELLKAPTV
ncbi:hypothetical protein L3Q82_000337 [Scortum barcoo]|uniref:Uncharacterized protein n=1 Tax=Scortum barcoo TaxID=214431 RepID=A0ACB8XAI9_9TELE|nr:hypothetical protein L3Q82_000337 [Scortum barcoo]